jgi:hypothetical protein
MLAACPAMAEPLRPTRDEVESLQTSRLYASVKPPGLEAFYADKSRSLGRMSVDKAAASLATKYGFPKAEFRRFLSAWSVAEHLSYDVSPRRLLAQRELIELIPLLRDTPMGLALLAQALEAATDKCPDEVFDQLMVGAGDPAVDAHLIAGNSLCLRFNVRAVEAAGPRSMPALMLLVSDGSLPPRSRMPVLSWLTSPEALARVPIDSRQSLAARLWQDYLTGLADAGLQAKMLEAFDALPEDLKAAVLSPAPRAALQFELDGIPVSLPADDVRKDDLSTIPAPLEQIAEAMNAVGRLEEARQVLAGRPGLQNARAAVTCIYGADRKSARACPNISNLPSSELFLDHLLNHSDEDPYPLAEVLLADAFNPRSSDDTLCNLFDAKRYPAICHPDQVEEPDFRGEDPKDIVAAEAALERTVPDFKTRRRKLFGDIEAPQAPALSRTGRETVIARPPDYDEKTLPAAYRDPVPPAKVPGLAPLPQGFDLVRAERRDMQVVAISLSQTLDHAGEVSAGGYWVHRSSDGGRTWQKPLYTGLADRFPYVVKSASRLPLLDNDKLRIAVDISEIDTATITYPPMGTQTRRSETDRYLTISLSALQSDSDGDGLTDIVARHLLLDRPPGPTGTPFVVGSDYAADCRATPPPERQAVVQLLARFTGNVEAALVQPVNRPPGEILGPSSRAVSVDDGPVFVLGRPEDFACLTSKRLIVIYSKADLKALGTKTPDFHAIELDPIVFNRERDRGYVTWSLGWTGGTIRLRFLGGKWQFEDISNWIT